MKKSQKEQRTFALEYCFFLSSSHKASPILTLIPTPNIKQARETNLKAASTILFDLYLKTTFTRQLTLFHPLGLLQKAGFTVLLSLFSLGI